MASFAPIRGTKAEIENTPLIDGQFLIETDQGNQNKIYVDSYDGSTPPALTRTMAGGGGHQILPPMDDPNDIPNEEKVVAAVNGAGATPQTDKISSLYGLNKWTNEKTKRFIVVGTNGAIGSSGIGTFPEDEDATVTEVIPVGNENPSSLGWYEINTNVTPKRYILSSDSAVVTEKKYFTEVIDESDWLSLSILTSIDAESSDDISVNLKFDPITNEAIVLGGYIIDTWTGNICVKFGNSIKDITNARVAIDITYTRNDYSIIS